MNGSYSIKTKVYCISDSTFNLYFISLEIAHDIEGLFYSDI